jgi:endoglucanase
VRAIRKRGNSVKFIISGVVVLSALFFITSGALAQQAPATQSAPGGPGPWYGEQFPGGRPRSNRDAKKLPRISVLKNHFVDPDGNVILFRGVSIADPDKIESQGHWNEELFVHIKDMGATLVRLPVHPGSWRGRTPEKYLLLLDQAVQWCTNQNMHVIIDWHSIGNLTMELYQNPMYNTTQRETFEFWRTIARHFHGHNTVAFYELFNEPTVQSGQLGSVSWSDWRRLNEQIIHLIRAYDKDAIELVAGFDWAYDLTPLRLEPIQADGIGYVTHPYANKRTRPWEPKWDEDFGFAAATYPMIATEIGFSVRDGKVVGPDDYGNHITGFLESKGISWMAWVYDPEWSPRLLKSWNFDLTGSGEFFKMAMHRDIGSAPKAD